MSTTWNPADKASGITLSSTNHVATSTSGNNSVRGTTSHASGKWYLEFPTITITSGGGLVGVGDAMASLTGGATNNAIGVAPGGGIQFFASSHVNPFAGAPSLTGHRLGLAIDFDNGLAWFRLDGGDWNGSPTADPASGAGGFSGAGFPDTLFPFTWIQNSGSTTINCGDSPFVDPVPASFAGWDVPPVVTNTYATVMS